MNNQIPDNPRTLSITDHITLYHTDPTMNNTIFTIEGVHITGEVVDIFSTPDGDVIRLKRKEIHWFGKGEEGWQFVTINIPIDIISNYITTGKCTAHITRRDGTTYKLFQKPESTP